MNVAVASSLHCCQMSRHCIHRHSK